MNVIPDILAVAMARIVALVRAVVMIVAYIGVGVMAVADDRAQINGWGMIDSVRRMRMRRRAEQESYSKQKPTKHIERSEEHHCWLPLPGRAVKSTKPLMLIRRIDNGGT